MDEIKKLKLQAVISLFAAKKDEAYAAILQILNSDNLELAKALTKQFKKLAKAEARISSVQTVFNNLENLNKLNKPEKDDDSPKNNS